MHARRPPCPPSFPAPDRGATQRTSRFPRPVHARAMHLALALLALTSVPETLPDIDTTTVRARRHECITAIALRDHVPVEQMVGTMLFTRPLLGAGYDAHVYLEATPIDDGRASLVAALEDA